MVKSGSQVLEALPMDVSREEVENVDEKEMEEVLRMVHDGKYVEMIKSTREVIYMEE